MPLRYRILTSVAIVIFLVAVAGQVATLYLDHIVGNKQYKDPYQTFNVAYIFGDDGKWDYVPIKLWMPVGPAQVQVITTNDIPIYTSFENVKLTLDPSR